MKHSDCNHSENSFGIHINSKSFSLADHPMSINNSNSNAIMIGSMITTPINSTSTTILSSALNTLRANSSVNSKGNTTSTPTLHSGVMGQLTYINPNNNSIKLVNLSKCQQLQNLNKDNSSIISNNAINVQFVTPILNNSSNLLNDCTGLSNSITKVDNSCVSNASVVLAGTSNQAMMTSNNPITCTRFILHSSQAPILPHGTVTLIPQHSEIGGGTILNSHLIKNTKYTLTGTKSTLPAIRPIIACTTSSIANSPSCVTVKQAIGKISSPRSLANYTINVCDTNSTISVQDLVTNKHVLTVSKEPQRLHTKTTPMVTITPNNNIRLALTSNILNSKVHVNPSKIQLISPKSRIHAGSPLNCATDGKLRDVVMASKDENAENPVAYSSQPSSYNPNRKRARKQHLKAVTNKLQKLASNGKLDSCSVINNIRHYVTDKSVSTPITIAPTTLKFASISTQHKPDTNSLTPTSVNNLSPQIVIPLKNPIQICTSKIQSSSNGLFNSLVSRPSGTNQNQVQIISRPGQQNLMLSPTFGRSLTNISPQKVIHITPGKLVNNSVVPIVKNEKLFADLGNKEAIDKVKVEDKKDAARLEVSEIKSEVAEDTNLKYSLYLHNTHWNPRRSHFEKECDVKIKKMKTTSNHRHLNSDDLECGQSSSDTDIKNTSWFLYKASTQFLIQKCFDEENLRNFKKLKEKFDIKPLKRDDTDEPVFQKICINKISFNNLPDQIDVQSFSEYTNPDVFGISTDILDSHLNITTTNQTQTHECSENCIFYSSEVPAVTQPPHIMRILDLIEGLIVKERKIIEKESEINEQCLRLLDSTDCSPLIANKNHNRIDKIRSQNGRRW